MIAPNVVEIKGTLQESPLAELLIEAIQAQLSGSFRLAHEDEKAIIYLNAGEVIFAVSNLRQHRLFEMLLQTEKISKDVLTEIPNFTSDLELRDALIARELFSKAEVNDFFSWQIKDILSLAFTWKTGGWSFSHLARAKEGVHFSFDTTNLLLDHARSLADETIIKRFRSFEEKFGLQPNYPVSLNLMPHEAFILSRFETSLMRIQDIKNMSGLSDLETLRSLYCLWFGGFLIRKNWNSVFTEKKIREILSAKLTLIKEVPRPIPQKIEIKPVETKQETVVEIAKEEKTETKIDETRLLKEHLKRIEDAESYYEILDVPIKANLAEIKIAYFRLAKQFHPDRYHQEVNTEIQGRVQNAFTEITRAYETLKDDSAREVYDFKLRKYLESVKSLQPSYTTPMKVDESDKAREEFEKGFKYLMDNDYGEALLFLARAAQMAPDNARYRAYYGKVLADDETQRHRAESELQMAVKLDPNNSTFRLMLAEFFIDYNLLKRAEGELQRLLAMFPNNKEAQTLLDSLAKK